MTVIKRNGSEVPFDLDKVKLSLSKANNSVPESERIDDDTINKWVKECIERFDPNDENDWVRYAGSGDTMVFVFKFDEDEE